MKNICSVFSLCVAAIATLVSVAFVGIAFSTDNWLHVTVERTRLEEHARSEGFEDMLQSLKSDIRYFDRVQGIFRVCFPHEQKPEPMSDLQPKTSKSPNQYIQRPRLYLNPVDEWCTNVDYYMEILDHGLLPQQLTRDGQIWFHFARSSVAAFCLYFMFAAIACVTGLMGCWKASGDHLISTATLMLLASLFGAAGMGFWHGARFFEVERVFDARLEFYQTWPEVLKGATSFSVGWSYIVAWIGVGVAFISSLSFSTAAICIRSEIRDMEQKAENMLRANVCRHPQLYHHQFLPRSGSSYLGGSVMSLTHQEMPPMPMHGGSGSSGYYSVGYPTMHHVYNDAVDSRTLQYKNVVKELEDAKL